MGIAGKWIVARRASPHLAEPVPPSVRTTLRMPHTQPRTSLKSDLVVLGALGSIVLILHAVTGNGYGFHRDELQTLDDALTSLPASSLIRRSHLFSAASPLRSSASRPGPCDCRQPSSTSFRWCWPASPRASSAAAGRAVVALLMSLGVAIVFSTMLQYNTPDYLAWALAAFFTARLLRTRDPRNWIGVGEPSASAHCRSTPSPSSPSASRRRRRPAKPPQRLRWQHLVLSRTLATLLVASPNLIWLATPPLHHAGNGAFHPCPRYPLGPHSRLLGPTSSNSTSSHCRSSWPALVWLFAAHVSACWRSSFRPAAAAASGHRARLLPASRLYFRKCRRSGRTGAMARPPPVRLDPLWLPALRGRGRPGALGRHATFSVSFSSGGPPGLAPFSCIRRATIVTSPTTSAGRSSSPPSQTPPDNLAPAERDRLATSPKTMGRRAPGALRPQLRPTPPISQVNSWVGPRIR